MNKQLISVVGLGKAGLPLAAVVANAGLEVIGVDIDTQRCEMINKGDNPLPEEPGLAEILQKYGGKTLKATPNPEEAAKEANVHIIIVPLFIDDQKQPDFSIIDAACSGIAKGLKHGDIVVLETTVPPGTTETRIRKNLEKESNLKAGDDFHLAYSPERIMTGYSISRFQEFPKVIGGITKECTQKGLEVYQQYCKNVHPVSSANTAEMVKVCEGVFRDVNIGLANELLQCCEKLNIDFKEMREAANHAFCDIHIAGLGVGGHCIPVYPWFLMNEMKKQELDLPVTRSARFLNDDMIHFWRDKVLEKIKDIEKPIKDIVLGVFGINYRPGVKETAYSRALPFIRDLEKLGCQVLVTDGFHSDEEIEKYGFKTLDENTKVDIAIMLNSTDFPEIKNAYDTQIVIH